ncbi:hypothetical protein EPI10_007538 [Gossypium australe]|uniref:Uncharacterized protein n=1 Tax=Gossypium australe TaxID=47621 RepID=A0A5B6WUJ5_9ROSI|nr:hypothetical protein EPI10_007538 [Gossypium australe]
MHFMVLVRVLSKVVSVHMERKFRVQVLIPVSKSLFYAYPDMDGILSWECVWLSLEGLYGDTRTTF